MSPACFKECKAAVFFLAAAVLLAFMLPAAGGGGEAMADSSQRVVLTFDDGYNFDHRILDFLSSQGITASAFVIGSWAQRNPELLQEMDALGWDVCNHTQNHPWLTKLTDQQIVAELNTCQAVIGSITGQYLPIFRPPGGFIDGRVMNVASSTGYAPVMWDFDSRDSATTAPPVQDRVNYIVGAAGDGDIILFHFGGRNTLELVTGVVQGLQQRGFSFVTLSELYGWKELVRGGDSGPGVASAALRHYFAEGTTRPGFEEWVLVLNPGSKTATVRAYYYSSREELVKEYSIPPRGRLSLCVRKEVPWQDDVSVVLESSTPVAAERMLYFNRGLGYSGGSLSRGVSEASSVFFFPEGSVRPGFEEYLAVFNPSGVIAARVGVEFRTCGGEKQEEAFDVDPLSRLTLRVNDLVESGDYSMVVRASAPVVAERSEYFVYNDILTGSHCSAGATMPNGRWFFAEGTTRDLFDNYLTVLNPCDYDTWLEVRMIMSDGSLRVEALGLAAGERKTLFLNSYLPPDIDFSLRVSSLLPVVAERAAYFQTHNISGGYCSPGVTQAQETWLFPEGCTSPGFSEWLALFNPAGEEQVVRVDYLCGDGEVVSREYLLPPEGRVTIDVACEAGQVEEVAMEVSSPGGIVAERSIYFNRRGL
ncbi:MAG: polysaccharide deacetylase family protein [Actinobacteria bacterium]|nr:polysaccharide deacetylase family protein [Actinomycetota bacterium]